MGGDKNRKWIQDNENIFILKYLSYIHFLFLPPLFVLSCNEVVIISTNNTYLWPNLLYYPY